MNKKVIIIEGYLASGKSTFALQLSKSVNVTYLIKDTFKEALCKNVSVTDRNESSIFSSVTFDGMMYVMERMFETGLPVIIEGNFVPAGVKKTDEAGTIRQLIDKYDYDSLTFKFSGDTRILHKRFIEREKTPERGDVNKMGFDVDLETFDTWCHNLDKFDVGGKVVKVDTTDFSEIDFNKYIEFAKLFLAEDNENEKIIS
ncbi:MAG: hypothetical protein J1E40_00720 [Oscillospiraceae bacterium]|nr:hypothetical protein [Oscillospiraceae bacterium]